MLEDRQTKMIMCSKMLLLGITLGVGLFVWEKSRVYFDIENYEDFITEIRGFQCDLAPYFFFLLYRRGILFGSLFFLGFSKCMRIFKYPCFILMGTGVGFLVAKMLHLYGMKGFIFVLALLLPHTPIYFWTICKIWNITDVYSKDSNRIYEITRQRTDNGKVLQIMTTAAVAIIGVIFECYVNLFFVKKIIIFFM